MKLEIRLPNRMRMTSACRRSDRPSQITLMRSDANPNRADVPERSEVTGRGTAPDRRLCTLAGVTESSEGGRTRFTDAQTRSGMTASSRNDDWSCSGPDRQQISDACQYP